MKIFRIIGLFLLLPFVFQACSIDKNPTDNQLARPPVISLETDYLKIRPGYTGEILGAKVIDSYFASDGGEQIIEINVPVNPDQVDSVQVISPIGETVKQNKTAEILRNYESGNVGIILFLSNEKNLSFKLRLIDTFEEN